MAEAFEVGPDPAEPRAPRVAALGSLALMIGGMVVARGTKGSALSDEVLEAACRFGEAALMSLRDPDAARNDDTTRRR